ncbi:hypothetical protein EPI10_028044 [Gossypium australe]|uniref:Uncharacterized protein n=1 Tax=Gossypium australe TaxID=47621 RepID=A0A5B6UWU0_9ROSI|nr:hypothetical protein EPI10_028044 [Gossypium australe]
MNFSLRKDNELRFMGRMYVPAGSNLRQELYHKARGTILNADSDILTPSLRIWIISGFISKLLVVIAGLVVLYWTISRFDSPYSLNVLSLRAMRLFVGNCGGGAGSSRFSHHFKSSTIEVFILVQLENKGVQIKVIILLIGGDQALLFYKFGGFVHIYVGGLWMDEFWGLLMRVATSESLATPNYLRLGINCVVKGKVTEWAYAQNHNNAEQRCNPTQSKQHTTRTNQHTMWGSS